MKGSLPKRESAGRCDSDPPVEWAIAAVAGAQYGVISLAQLIEAGLTSAAVRKRVTARRLRRVYPGVFATGHAPLTRDARYLAAVLACGEGAALSPSEPVPPAAGCGRAPCGG
jgi:hypothetical protein